jgi:hypothetical protein
MREWLPSSPDPGAWPESPGRRRALPEERGCDRTAAITRVILVTGDTRRLILISAVLLTADLVGAAIVVSALLGRGRVLALGSVGLLMPVILSWLVTAVLVLLAEGPVSSAFSELRRATGAPVDPSVPWSPLGVRPLADSEVTWDHVVPLIAAATRQHARARLALSAAVFTTAVFLLWMALSLAAATLT